MFLQHVCSLLYCFVLGYCAEPPWSDFKWIYSSSRLSHSSYCLQICWD